MSAGPPAARPPRWRRGALLVGNLSVVIPSSSGFIRTCQRLAVAIAFSLLTQAVWYIPTMIMGGVIAIREVHRDATRARTRMEPPVPSPG